MARSKIYKIITGILLLVLIGCLATYSQLSNRHRAIVKTTLLHKSGMIDGKWSVDSTGKVYNMISPSFLIDGIYKSMEGPMSAKYVQLSQDSALIYMTGFKVTAIDAKSRQPLSNEFICHTNVDFNAAKYYSRLNLPQRIGNSYPRMTSLSNGSEALQFPAGYGIPMHGNDMLYLTTQSLNHNYPKIKYLLKHNVAINYTDKIQKPLMSRTVFIMLPYDESDPYSPTTSSDLCIPVETKNHVYDDGKGNKHSGHWVVPEGKNTYRSNINQQLQIADSIRLHSAALHVHPFATSFTLRNISKGEPVFTSKIVNRKGKIGLQSVPGFTSDDGVWLYANNDYELVLEVDNTSGEQQDMMGSMFLFFYDAELDALLSSKPPNQEILPKTASR
ncbi:MAG: hypothetical protein ITG00_08050 [Flavobacterium sp.]|nr:hypothetical protein [Flavobacterium sp.]